MIAVSFRAGRRHLGGSSSPLVHRRPPVRSPRLPTFPGVINQRHQENEVNRTSIRRALVPGLAVVTLALSGCAAGNDTSSASRQRRRGQGAERHAERRRFLRPGVGPERLARRLPERQRRRRHRQLRPGRLRHRARELPVRGVRLRRLRLGAERRRGRGQEGRGAVRRQAGHRGPGVRQPDRGRLPPRGRRRAAALRPGDRPDLRRQDHQVERPAHRGRQPGRPAAVHHDHPRAPLGRLGDDQQLHRLPGEGCGRQVDLPARRRVADQGRGGRRGHLRPRGRGQGRRRHHRLRRREPGR